MGLLLGLVSGCFSPDPPIEGDESSSGSSGPSAGVCVPGETQTCLCVGNQEGVQSCNADGSGFDACECTGATTNPTSGDPATTTGADSSGDATSSPSGGPSDSSGSDSEPSTSDTGPIGDAYLQCVDSGCEQADEICLVFGGGPEPDATVCIVPDCRGDAECPAAPRGSSAQVACIDVTEDDITECVLLCVSSDECPTGMECVADVICMWPG